jgi:hypothetical protein
VSVKGKKLTLPHGEESWASRLAGNMRFSPSQKEKKCRFSPFEKEKVVEKFHAALTVPDHIDAGDCARHARASGSSPGGAMVPGG